MFSRIWIASTVFDVSFRMGSAGRFTVLKAKRSKIHNSPFHDHVDEKSAFEGEEP